MAEHRLTTTQKQDPIIEMLSKYKQTIAAVLPKHLTAEKMLRIASTSIFRDGKLRKCTPLSLVNSVIEISILGLDIGRTAHIVPFGDKATVIIDYKGYIDLAHRSNQINSFPMKSVYQNDSFDYSEGTERWIKHRPTEGDRGELRAAYAICNYKHGGQDFELIFRPDAMAAKAKAPAKNSKDSPWNKPDEEHWMWEKTAVRRLAKRVPQSPELQRAVELEDYTEAGMLQDINYITEDMIDIKPLSDDKKEPLNTGAPKENTKEAINQRLDDLKSHGQITPDKQDKTSGEQDLEASEGNEEELENPKDYQCPYCPFSSQSERGLKKHITQSHPDPKKQEGLRKDPGSKETPTWNELIAMLNSYSEVIGDVKVRDILQGITGDRNLTEFDFSKYDELEKALRLALDKENE